jgi:hypothetical protein
MADRGNELHEPFERLIVFPEHPAQRKRKAMAGIFKLLSREQVNRMKRKQTVVPITQMAHNLSQSFSLES